jgi:hypothetical protein
MYISQGNPILKTVFFLNLLLRSFRPSKHFHQLTLKPVCINNPKVNNVYFFKVIKQFYTWFCFCFSWKSKKSLHLHKMLNWTKISWYTIIPGWLNVDTVDSVDTVDAVNPQDWMWIQWIHKRLNVDTVNPQTTECGYSVSLLVDAVNSFIEWIKL